MTMTAVRRRLDLWAALRLGLVLLWVAWAALAWWTAPRPATADDARADLAAGRIVAAQWATGWSDDALWAAPPRPAVSADGGMLVWRTTDLRVHHADVEVRRALEALPVGPAVPGGFSLVALALIVLGLAVLINGPAPVVGTRWYWFWMGGVPFGLGLLYWLAVERPWARPTPPAPDPKTGKPRRRTGLTGFLFMILSGIALSILVAIVGGVISDAVVPRR